jgi:hypothetical protein
VGHWQRGRLKEGPEYVIDPVTGCWNWQRKITHGYGYATVNRKAVRAARLFYERFVGSIPEGLTVDHTCRNRACVNPAHLEAVSVAENIRRKPSTKLTIEDARRIRQLASSMSQSEISKQFGIDPSSVSKIISGSTWRE